MRKGDKSLLVNEVKKFFSDKNFYKYSAAVGTFFSVDSKDNNLPDMSSQLNTNIASIIPVVDPSPDLIFLLQHIPISQSFLCPREIHSISQKDLDEIYSAQTIIEEGLQSFPFKKKNTEELMEVVTTIS